MEAAAAAVGISSRPGWRFYALLLTLAVLLIGGRVLVERHGKDAVLLATANTLEHSLSLEASYVTDGLQDRLRHYEAMAAMGDFVTTASLSGNTQIYHSALARLTAIATRPDDDIVQVTAMDAKGIVLWGTKGGVGIDLSDREHYQAVAIDGQERYFGRPVVGRVSGKRTMQYSRAMRENGKLVAITVVSVDPAVMVAALRSDLYGELEPSTHFHVLRSDGIPIGTSKGAPSLIGLPIDVIMRARSAVLRVVDIRSQPLLVAANYDAGNGLIVAATLAASQVERAAMPALTQARTITYIFTIGVVVLLLAAGLAWSVHLRGQRSKLMAAAAAVGFARLRELAEHTREVVIVWRVGPDNKRTFEYVSPQSIVELGVEAEELRRNPALLKPHPDDRDLMRSRMRELLLGEVSRDLEYRIVLPGGSIRWIDITSRPIGRVVEGGMQFRRFITCLHNVTEYRLLQERLLNTNARLEQLTTDSPCVLYQIVVAMQGGTLRVLSIPYVSRSIFRHSGYTPEQFIDPGSLHKLMSPEAAAARMEMLARAMRDDEATTDYPLRRADGRLIWVRDMVRVSKRRVGSCFLTGFAIDVTREKQFSDVLDETSKLASLGEMAAGIAHELHQPLAAISLNVELIALDLPADAPRSARIHDRLGKIMALVDRSANVIRHIRDFSRSEGEQPVAIDLRRAVEAVAEIMAPRVRHGGCAIEIAMPSRDEEAVLDVLGHIGPFEQVMINLIGNAVDAYSSQPAGDEAVRIIEIEVRVNLAEIEIAISDHAGGVPAVALPRIFEPFFTTKDVGKGTGLGLSICRRIVNEMGGRLDAANHDGGAVFTIRLPRVEAAASSAPTLTNPEAAAP